MGLKKAPSGRLMVAVGFIPRICCDHTQFIRRVRDGDEEVCYAYDPGVLQPGNEFPVYHHAVTM